MPEEPTVDEVKFSDQTTFDHNGLGLRLVLRKSANDLVQRDIDKFMRKFAEQPQSLSTAVDNGLTLRAALRSDWIESLTTPAGAIATGNDVDGMKPSHVRWAAEIIDRIYNTAREIPNA
jgi:hypothetical protein